MQRKNTREIGEIGELYALNYLNTHNYEIIAQNYHARTGEIDIVALDLSQKAVYPYLVFVEVKSRTSDRFGSPQQALTPLKRRRIFSAAHHFCQKTSHKYPFPWRFDLISLKLDPDLQLRDIQHLKNYLS